MVAAYAMNDMSRYFQLAQQWQIRVDPCRKSQMVLDAYNVGNKHREMLMWPAEKRQYEQDLKSCRCQLQKALQTIADLSTPAPVQN